MKFVSYTRCSKEEQAKGFTHEYQLDGILSNPLARGNEHMSNFVDQETGRNFGRQGFEEMYKYCKVHKPDFVFIYKWDRFGRNVEETFKQRRLFEEIGIKVNCVDFYIDFEDSTWSLQLALQAGLAQSESDKISERTRDGNYQAKKGGYFIAKPPVGYIRKFINDRASIEPCPRLAPLVARIFKEVAEGATPKDLLRQHSAQLSIKSNAFYHMLRNKVYISICDVPTYKYHAAMTVPYLHEPIVSLSIFNKVQELTGIKTKSHINHTAEFDLYLKSVIRDEFGQLMTSYKSKGKSGKRFGYYERKGKKGSIISADRAHAVIQYFIDQIKFEFDDEQIEIIKNLYQESDTTLIEQLKINERDISKQINTLKKIQEDYTNGFIDGQVFSDVYKNIKEKLTHLQLDNTDITQRLQFEAASFGNFFEHLTKFSNLYNKSNNHGRLALLKAIFPEGFTITKPNYLLRTPIINQIITSLSTGSTDYDIYINEYSPQEGAIFIKGATPHNFRTHLTLLLLATS